jgi:cellulose synthase/poly-beta-1,6-N-acetylglucosamine synthase-like glycosyltransferase
MKVSLIISVYKDVSSLRTVLEGLRFQRYKNYEIVVSEDGESEEMQKFLADYSFDNPILHLTQSDVGWRKNQALNRAIRESSGDYLVFIDGDCVLHHRFMENHVRFAGRKKILAGKRVKLGPAFTALFKEGIGNLPALERKVEKEKTAMRKDGARFYEEAFYIDPDGWLSFIPKMRRMHQLKGCNMSFYREDIEAINGFDEDYVLPAIGEDIDLTWRFHGLGYKLFSLRNLAVQYHLYHKENWTDQSRNLQLMQTKMGLRQYVCPNGLKKLNTT